jgi:hypothetical protein
MPELLEGASDVMSLGFRLLAVAADEAAPIGGAHAAAPLLTQVRRDIMQTMPSSAFDETMPTTSMSGLSTPLLHLCKKQHLPRCTHVTPTCGDVMVMAAWSLQLCGWYYSRPVDG